MIGASETFVGFLCMLAMMFLGLHVATAVFATAALGAVVYLGLPTLWSFGGVAWGAHNDFLLAAIPLYVLLGEILVRSGLTERMYAALSSWLTRLPGGLLHTNVVSSGMFAAVSGSSVATAATIGTVALPSLEKRGYGERLALGSIAAGATLGILIPPSINLIIYGAITNTSIGKLFMAGLVPGLLLCGLFMVIIAILTYLYPSVAGTPAPTPPLRERIAALGELLPPLIIFLLVMGSIYFGWATPTEAAAIGVVAALAVAAAYGRLSFKVLHEAFVSTLRTASMILFIIMAAFYLNRVIGILGIPQTMTQFVGDIGATPLATIFALMLFYLILGCFLETLSMLIATAPVVVPIIVHLGFDKVWFGIFLVLMMEMALFTPPMGMNLYVVQGVRRTSGSISDVIIGTLPFLIAMLFFVVFIIFVPEVALFLPGQLF